MERKDYEVFALSYKKIEAICTEIMNKLACRPDDKEDYDCEKDCVIHCENPEFESLVVNENNDIEFRWYDTEDDEEYDTLIVPKDVFINENVDEWCENRLAEQRRMIEERNKEMRERREAEERALYERLKKKYGDS